MTKIKTTEINIVKGKADSWVHCLESEPHIERRAMMAFGIALYYVKRQCPALFAAYEQMTDENQAVCQYLAHFTYSLGEQVHIEKETE